MKKGEEVAFAKLYDYYAPSLYGVVSKIVKSDEEGADVLQEALVKIWKNIQSYDQKKGSFFTWMLNIARNTAIDNLRKSQRKPTHQIQDGNSDEGLADNAIFTSVDTIGVKEIVGELSEDQQLMVDYVYFKGYTQQEIADELQMPLGTVKTRVRSALKQLREAFISLIFWT